MENPAVRWIIDFLNEAVEHPYDDPGQEANELFQLNDAVLASAQHALESANYPDFASRPEHESWYVTLAAIPTERRLLRSLYRTKNFQENLARWWEDAAPRADSGSWGPRRKGPRRAASGEVPASQVIAERVFGYLGLLLLVLSTLDDTDSRQHQDLATRWRASPSEDIKAAAARQRVCKVAVENRFVRRAVIDMFDPSSTPAKPEPPEAEQDGEKLPNYKSPRPPQHWWNVDINFTKLEFYKYGTTSFILTARHKGKKEGGELNDPELVLKCVLPAFASISDIAEATRMYAEEYGSRKEKQSDALVKVLSSCDRWILMEFVPGETLEEFLNDKKNAPAALETRSRSATEDGDRAQPQLKPRLDLLYLLIPPLLDALDGLAEAGLRHEDLSPSNVILQETSEGSVRFTLIDAGRNYVYSQSAAAITMAQNRGSAYVAPESGELAARQDKVDVYSLGQLIIAICGVGRPADGSVPDAIFARTPTLARFVEDLIEQDPERRLLLFGCNCEQQESQRYKWLASCFKRELDALLRAEGEPISNWATWDTSQRRKRMLIILGPISGAPFRQQRLMRERMMQVKPDDKQQQALLALHRGTTDPMPGNAHNRRPCDGILTLRNSARASRSLARWSWVSFAMWYLAVGVTAYCLTRDITRLAAYNPSNAPAAGFGGPTYAQERFTGLCADLVGIAFIMCGVKYYQNIYSGLTSVKFGELPGSLQRRSIWAESIIRANAFVAGLIAIPIMLFFAPWWPIGGAIGLINCYFVNKWGSAFVRSSVSRARHMHFSTVPAADREIAGVRMYDSWAPSMAVYVFIVTIFATLIEIRVLQDIVAYAAVVFIINIGLLYLFKCSIQADPVRFAIMRSYLAAERLQRLSAHAEYKEMAKAARMDSSESAAGGTSIHNEESRL